MSDSSGVDFNFTFAPGVIDEQILGFELAGEVWSQYLTDTYQGEDLQINIHVEIGDDLLPENIVGGAFPTIETGIIYQDIYNAIQNDITTANDQIVADNLLNTNTIDLLVGENIIDQNFQMHSTTANLKALGLIAGDEQALDGFIVMNSLVNANSVDWNYSYLEEPQEGTLDFLSVALHELGHTIGFISGIDYQGWSEESANYDGEAITHMTSMDLFRYSMDSINLDINDLTFGEAAYFTIDGTLDNSLDLSTGADFQGSHWKEGELLGIMNPTIGLGERWHISGNDLKVFDAIGWDVDYTAAIDLEVLFNEAQLNVDNASIIDRTSEVDDILYTESYNWARRSSTSSSSGWWWARRSSTSSSSGWWLTGYWSTYSTETTSTDTNTNTNDYWNTCHSSSSTLYGSSFDRWDWKSWKKDDDYSGWKSWKKDDDYSGWKSWKKVDDYSGWKFWKKDDDYSGWGSWTK